MLTRLFVVTSLLLWAIVCDAQAPSAATSLLGYKGGSYVVKDFHFRSGQVLPELRLAYATVGTPLRDAGGQVSNAVLLIHGTSDSHEDYLESEIVNALYGRGQALDLEKYFLIVPDCIGHGKSSKPSDGLRAKFPNYGYEDMVTAEYELVTHGLGIKHLHLVMRDSMGGMHTWLWGERYPDMMDGLMPFGSYPAEIAGRNRLWRKIIIESIRNDPDWNNGNYDKQPRSVGVGVAVTVLMVRSAAALEQSYPTREALDAAFERGMARSLKNLDANDQLYAYAASSDYNPRPDLEKIKAPLLAINFADDTINPPELRIFEREMARVKRGRFVIVPVGERSIGHLTAGRADVWQDYLREFLTSLGDGSAQSR